MSFECSRLYCSFVVLGTSATAAYSTYGITTYPYPAGTSVSQAPVSGFFSIRLTGGGAGRLEVYYNNQWGTVCDDYFDSTDAQVVCRELGYSGGTWRTVFQNEMGTGQILLDDLACTGSERKLSDCPRRSDGGHDCHHGEDVFVDCTNGTSRTTAAYSTYRTTTGYAAYSATYPYPAGTSMPQQVSVNGTFNIRLTGGGAGRLEV